MPNDDAARDTTDDATDGARPPGATDVRVRVLRGEAEIPRICALCAAVFKEVAVPLPDELENDPIEAQVGDFLESRYETAMIKDLNSVITRNMREKRRAANQAHAEFGRVKARATARELQALQRTRTSVDALTTEQLTEMRARISDEIEAAREELARTPRSPEEIKRARAGQWIQLVADGAVAGGGEHRFGLRARKRRREERDEVSENQRRARVVQTRADAPPADEGREAARAHRERDVAGVRPGQRVPASVSVFEAVPLVPGERGRGAGGASVGGGHGDHPVLRAAHETLGLRRDVATRQHRQPGARALYEGLGYAIVSEDPWFYLDRRYLMRKKLDA